jgi:chromosome segregation ATPase
MIRFATSQRPPFWHAALLRTTLGAVLLTPVPLLMATEDPSTLQDIAHRLPLAELRAGLEKANEQLRNGLAGSDQLQEQLQDLRGQLAQPGPTAEEQAQQSFARIDAGLSARHQALEGAVNQIDQTQDLLHSIQDAVAAFRTGLLEQPDSDPTERRAQLQRQMDDLTLRLKQAQNDEANPATLRQLAADYAFYRNLLRIEQGIGNLARGEAMERALVGLEKILSRLDKSLGSGRKKAYLALKAVEQSAGQTNALRDLHGQLGAMEMFLAELKESLAASSLPSWAELENGVDIGDMEDLWVAVDDRTQRLGDLQEEVLVNDDDDAYLDGLIAEID